MSRAPFTGCSIDMAKKKKATPAKSRPRKSEPEAAAWAALGYTAGKRGNRNALAEGATAVDLTVRGKVNGVKIDPLRVKGDLVQGADTKAASSKNPPVDHLLACVLEQVALSKRDTVLEQIRAHFAKFKTLPPVAEKTRGDCAAALRTIRSTTTTCKQGPLTLATADHKKR